MQTNLEKYKAELNALERSGERLLASMQKECHPKQFEETYKKAWGVKKYTEFLKILPNFSDDYQKWYSAAHSVVKQLIPDRLNDFVRYYEKSKTRKTIEYGNYVIEDYLQGMRVTRYGSEVVVDKSAAIPQFTQQLAILKSANERFESSLFDIKQLVQADLLDSELDAARELQKYKFFRAAGAISGVVLEKHLAQVCTNHKIFPAKKNPTINDFNESLKTNEVIDVPQWRFIQHLADIRNLCDHNKAKEPGNADIEDLISGTEKITKTIF